MLPSDKEHPHFWHQILGEGILKTTLGFRDLLGLQELIESYYTHGCTHGCGLLQGEDTD